MTVSGLRGKVAVVGIGESDIGDVGPERLSIDLLGQATVEALADAGLSTSSVDGIWSNVGTTMSNLDVGEYLGIRPRYSGGAMVGGSSFVSHLYHAAVAVAAGECDTALIAYGSTSRAARTRAGFRRSGVSEEYSYEGPFGLISPASQYALAAARHMYEFGTTREQIADVAVASRQWAARNPRAFVQRPLTRDDVITSRMLSSPLTVRDACLVTDGGAALVVTSAERAADLARPPVFVLGAGEAHHHRQISQMPDLTTTAAVDSGARAFEMAGLGPSDVDVVQLYDAFTINVILFLEDLGFCKKGEGGGFVQDGGIAPGGHLPVNTNGGGLSYTHPGMYGLFLMTEAVRQLRGDAPAQVAGAEVALVHGNGGYLSSQVSAVFGTRATV
jgi:acetyl-CoA acetyltransferase